MSLASRFFRWHRWLGYLVALQVLTWVAGGTLFAWLPFQGWVKSADHVRKPQAEWPAGWAQRLAAGLPADLAASGVQAVATAAGPALRVKSAGGERWFDADGRELAPPDEAAVARFAASLYQGPGRLAALQRLEHVPPRLGIVHELHARAPVWLARFDDPWQTRLYLDARSGELLAARNEAWVWYDFFWRLHVMDYGGGEDFNNPLLRTAAPLALALVLTGAVLLTLALRRAWRTRRRQPAPQGHDQR
ncbi:MAG: PepSY domain-containing protein [Rubrivivax sp.]